MALADRGEVGACKLPTVFIFGSRELRDVDASTLRVRVSDSDGAGAVFISAAVTPEILPARLVPFRNGPSPYALRSGRCRLSPRPRFSSRSEHPAISKDLGGFQKSREMSKVPVKFGAEVATCCPPRGPMSPEACVWLFSASISSPEQEVKTSKTWQEEFGIVLNPCTFSALDAFAKDDGCNSV